MKELGVASMYEIVGRMDDQSTSDEGFRLYLLKKLQNLILAGQLRDDRLPELAIILNFKSSRWQTSILEFFRRYFANLSSEKVCRVLFG
ncbi:hypothetical protein PINS_up005715 [Pythium insidiosum]|nr:hypothetical protein PINS_up005715 [Pythium insidiosum]